MKNVNHVANKEEPQTIITGFDTSTVITKKPLQSRRSRSPFQHIGDMNMNCIDNETSKSTSPTLENMGSRKSSFPQKESLFGRPRSYKNDQNGQLSLSKTSSRKGKTRYFSAVKMKIPIGIAFRMIQNSTLMKMMKSTMIIMRKKQISTIEDNGTSFYLPKINRILTQRNHLFHQRTQSTQTHPMIPYEKFTQWTIP